MKGGYRIFLVAALFLKQIRFQTVSAFQMFSSFVAETNRRSGFDHKKVFIFMTYMNLINVFLIILILTLWKWW